MMKFNRLEKVLEKVSSEHGVVSTNDAPLQDTKLKIQILFLENTLEFSNNIFQVY